MVYSSKTKNYKQQTTNNLCSFYFVIIFLSQYVNELCPLTPKGGTRIPLSSLLGRPGGALWRITESNR